MQRERESRRRRAELYRGARFVQRLGGSAGREAYELVLGGLSRPGNLNDCDPVVIAIDPGGQAPPVGHDPHHSPRTYAIDRLEQGVPTRDGKA